MAGIALVAKALRLLVKASAVLWVPTVRDRAKWPGSHSAARGTPAATLAALEQRVLAWLENGEDDFGEATVALGRVQWQVVMSAVRSPAGDRIGAIAMARPSPAGWSATDIAGMQTFANLCGAAPGAGSGAAPGAGSGAAPGAGSGAAPGADILPAPIQVGLDALVTRVAVELMSVSASDLTDSLEGVLRLLTEYFQVDTSFLRRTDFERDMTVLVAEWPRRLNIPDPDPLGDVPFGSDPVFDACRDLKEPFVMRPAGSPDAYQDRVQEGSGVQGVSVAMVPLIGKARNVGVLGFIKFGDRSWDTVETNALQAVASLLVQLQARVDAEERLQYQAYHDHLTSLPNRRALLEELDRRLSGEEGRTTALLFLDLDRFKSMNDSLGHSGGDLFLVMMAGRLRQAMRAGDFVARLAGDEFVFLLQSPAGEAAALAVADKLLELVAGPMSIGGHQLSRTASVGISLGRSSGTTHEDRLQQADAALHRAKAQGGNQAVVFDQALRASTKLNSETEVQLRDAMHQEELLLYYQPEVDLRTGQLLAVEALVRWDHPQRGILPAVNFIKVAEDSGLIVDIGRWVLAEAGRQMAAWRHQYPQLQFTMRVNMSPAQLATRNIVRLVDDCLRVNDLPGDVICIEITEHAVMQDLEQALAVLHQLKGLGVSLAIDDFGTGYSSMSQLKRLPVDALKVDQTFVAGLGIDSGDRAIVEATVGLAQSFGLEAIAEGVETKEVARELVDLGCYRAQGYLLCRPKAAADLEPVLRRGGVSPRTFGQPAGEPART